jgi:hypothetical protein
MSRAESSPDASADARTKEKVFDQVRRCLMNLVGGSGHLACFHIVSDTFRITKIEEISDDLTEYHFSARTYRESEFTVAAEDEPEPPPEAIEGSIVLDGEFQLTRDPEGRIRLQPWRALEHLQ